MMSTVLLALASFQSQADEAVLRVQNAVARLGLQDELATARGRVFQALGVLQVLERDRKDATGAAARELDEKIHDARQTLDETTVRAKRLEVLILHSDKWLGKRKK